VKAGINCLKKIAKSEIIMIKSMEYLTKRCIFMLTTDNENGNIFSHNTYSYIRAVAGTSRKGHYSWLSNACTGDSVPIPLTFKDNHMQAPKRIVHFIKWKELQDFPGYFISSNGLFKSSEGLIAPYKRKRYPYFFVIVRKIVQGVKINHKKDVHHLVWLNFGTGLIPGYEIHHIDLNFQNNDISNLMLMPKSEHKKFHWQIAKHQSA